MGGSFIEGLFWENLTFEVRNKWNWYFEYRAALLKIKHPKSYIETYWGSKEITNDSPEDMIRYKRSKRMTVLKQQISKYKNAVLKYELAQKQLLIPDYGSERYINTIAKITDLEKELANLIIESKE